MLQTGSPEIAHKILIRARFCAEIPDASLEAASEGGLQQLVEATDDLDRKLMSLFQESRWVRRGEIVEEWEKVRTALAPFKPAAPEGGE